MSALNPCQTCGDDAAYGYGARRSLSLLRWFCTAHRDDGEAYWRRINDN